MKNKTETILTILHVFAWIAFVGLLVKGGAMLTSFAVSMANPDAAKNFYDGTNLYNLKQFNNGYYIAVVSFLVAMVALKAQVAWLVIKVLSKIKLTSPFTTQVSEMLEQISYYILALWSVALLHNAYIKWLAKSVEELYAMQVSDEFIFIAGVVFVFAQIFKKGVQLQAESELTV